MDRAPHAIERRTLMLVQDIMKTDVVAVTPDTRLAEALRLASARGIRHLVVTEGDRLAGIVSDRDLKRAMSDTASLETPITKIMSAPVITAAPTFAVEDAARIMVNERISALPVAVGGRLAGIVTETDVLTLFVRALGAAEPSSRLDIELGRERGALADVVAVVEASGAPISSVMTLTESTGRREAVVRVATINPGTVVRALEARGYPVRDSWRGAA